MKRTEFIQPDHKVAADHSVHILLHDIAFGAIEGKLLGGPLGNILDYRIPQVCVTWSMQDDAISAAFPFSLVVETKHEPHGLAAAIADISVLINIEYKLVQNNGTIPLEHLPHVIGTLGYMHAWPYFRADVQWLTTKLGFPALVLPVVLSGQIGDRLAIWRYPIGANGSPIIEAESSPTTPPALPQAASPAPKRSAKSRRKG